MASPKLEPVVLTDEERQVLEGWARRRKTAQALALRSRIILACADGGSVSDVAAELGISRTTAGKWRSRSWRPGWQGERRAAPGPAAHDHRRARGEGDRRDAGAAASGRGHALVHEVDGQVSGPEPDRGVAIWRAFGLKPHAVQSWKLSTDPQFIDKVRDVVGLYMSPPENALVLCVDEKSQIQALDRTAPCLPLAPAGSIVNTHPCRERRILLRHPRRDGGGIIPLRDGARSSGEPRHAAWAGRSAGATASTNQAHRMQQPVDVDAKTPSERLGVKTRGSPGFHARARMREAVGRRKSYGRPAACPCGSGTIPASSSRSLICISWPLPPSIHCHASSPPARTDDRSIPRPASHDHRTHRVRARTQRRPATRQKIAAQSHEEAITSDQRVNTESRRPASVPGQGPRPSAGSGAPALFSVVL